ncbi:MAG: hypothetical protein R6U15_08005 [Candidatus Izemoplasmatales bacterium]
MNKEQNFDNSKSQQLNIGGGFPIKDTYTKEEVKKIALAFTRAATPSKYIDGIEDRFEKVWQLNFGS